MGKVVRSWYIKDVKTYHIGVKFVKTGRRQENLLVCFVLSRLYGQNRLR
jgi:hypothetical protein